jgi:predicted SnoaL-like aldol condensation-catalyzing enzyme
MNTAADGVIICRAPSRQRRGALLAAEPPSSAWGSRHCCEVNMACERVPAAGPRLVGVCLIVLLWMPQWAAAQDEETNKALARRFYEEVWFSRNLAAVDELVAADYVVHDTGGRKAVREPADEQKQTADLFWQRGMMSGDIDFQIAEGDLVATRWQWRYQPRAWGMRLLMIGGRNPVPIINVFRFEEGKIVEIWNHRHDIDVGFAANLLRMQGFAVGVLSSVLVAFGLRVRRRRRGRVGMERVAHG